jgi:hypothetical protein
MAPADRIGGDPLPAGVVGRPVQGQRLLRVEESLSRAALSVQQDP